MYSVTGNTTSLVLGFPIRTSSDQRSVDSSPRHNAASHVLHRPLMPRHPPCALKHLQHKKPQSRSLSNFKHRNTKLHHNKPTTAPATRRPRTTPASLMLATTIHESNTTPHHQVERKQTHHHPLNRGWHTPLRFPHGDEVKSGPVASKPNSVFDDPPTPHRQPRKDQPDTSGVFEVRHVHQTRHPLQAEAIQRFATVSVIRDMRAGHGLVVLLRKEVIQPHLPVRLPCYDFVPIADPTFDGSLPRGVRPPASGVTDFHDVTGGVYKARERIHRSVADLRLLATPTSRGRVADPDPN